MSISDWIAFGALLVAAIGPTIDKLRVTGRRDGKLDALIEHYGIELDDHETRIRTLEKK